jgi:hypothetical protein
VGYAEIVERGVDTYARTLKELASTAMAHLPNT